MTEFSCDKGAFVIKEGDNGSDMFVIDTGELEVIKGPPGEEVTLKTLKDG